MGFLGNIFKKETDGLPQNQPRESLVPQYPEEEFGVQLVQLVEVALSDKILTTSERAMLCEVALAKGLSLARFEAYVDMLKEKRGVTEIDDGNIPLKKYNQPTEVASELKTMIDMALADGYLSDEERRIILNEAAKLGVNIPVFEKGLNAIFMTGRIKEVIDSKYPTSIVRRWVKSEDTADGKVVDTYEEITTAFRPNTNRGKTNEILKTTTKRILKVTRKKEMTEEIVDFLCNVDYGMVLSALAVVSIMVPIVGQVVVPVITILKKSADEMNNSTGKKDINRFLSSAFGGVTKQCVDALPQVQGYLGPNGGKIVSGIMTAHKVYKENSSK